MEKLQLHSIRLQERAMTTGLQFTVTHDPVAAIARYIARCGQRPNIVYSRDGKAWGGLRGEVNQHVPSGFVLVGYDAAVDMTRQGRLF